jgi:tetratricopeptide (TPR) repeat protein
MYMNIEWIEVYMKEAELLIINNEVERGMRILNELLYAEPGYGSLHNHIGWAHLYFTSNYSLAEVHLNAAVKFHPELPAPYLHLGNLYMRTERHAAALEVAAAGLARAGANRAALLEVTGQAYEMTHEFRKAIKAYREASLASMNNFEINNFNEGIKRCRKKRWMKIIG